MCFLVSDCFSSELDVSIFHHFKSGGNLAVVKLILNRYLGIKIVVKFFVDHLNYTRVKAFFEIITLKFMVIYTGFTQIYK